MESEGDDSVELTGELSTSPFSCSADRSLHSEIVRAACCPTMDLVAVCHADGLLAVHRMSWQRLWTSPLEEPATCMCWRPDGKVLAVGHSDGSLCLLDVEDGSLQKKLQPHARPVASLGWTDAGPAWSAYAATLHPDSWTDRTARVFATAAEGPGGESSAGGGAGASGGAAMQGPGAGQGSYPSIYRSHTAPSGNTPPGPPPPTVLVSVDSGAQVCVHLYGTFLLFQTEALARGGMGQRGGSEAEGGATPLRVELSLDLSRLYLLTHHAKSGLELHSWRVPPLSDSLGLATAAAHHLEECGRLIDVLRSSYTAAVRAQTDASKAFCSKMDELGKLLQDYGFNMTADEELVMYVCYGVPSQALLHWLTQALGAGGIRKLARQCDSAFGEAHRCLNLHAQPGLEQLLFRVSEVAGLVKTAEDDGKDAGGEQTTILDRLTRRLSVLALRLEAAKQVALRSGLEHRTFFLWLMRALSRQGEDIGFGPPPNTALQHLPPNNPQALVPFLSVKSRFVGPLSAPVLERRRLEPGAASRPPDVMAPAEMEDYDEWEALGVQRSDVDATADPMQAAAAAAEDLARVAAALRDKVAAQLRPEPTIQLCPGALTDPGRPIDLRVSRLKAEAQGHHPWAEVAFEADVPSFTGAKQRHVVIVSLRPDSGGAGSIHIGAYKLPSGQHCGGMAFYKQGSLFLARQAQQASEGRAPSSPNLAVVDYASNDGALLRIDPPRHGSLLEASVVQGALSDLSDLEAGGRTRPLQHGPVFGPMCCSGARGLALVQLTGPRALVWDLEGEDAS